MKHAKLAEGQKEALGVAVAAISFMLSMTKHLWCFFAFISLLLSSVAYSAVLPEERADVMYHSYDGGGVQITGPSVLVRKNFKESISVYGNYYVDQITSASIDVITSGASQYTEERTEYSLGAEYLYDKATLSLSGTQSTENDYEAETLSFDVSQTFFADMTTFAMGYSHGDDLVGKVGEPRDEWVPVTHDKFRIGFTQVLTAKWLMGISAEKVSDQGGRLNNPYRNAHFLANNGIASQQTENYPDTRNSDSFALRSIYYLPYRASIRAEVRNFSDNWGIDSRNLELRYIHPHKDQLTFQVGFRAYSQTQADFYSDLFIESEGMPDFFARDKEMSEFDSYSLSLGIFYDIDKKWWSAIKRTTINLQYDYMMFDYKNFHDATGRLDGTSGFAPGEEPLYELEANVIRFFISFFY